MDPDTDIGGPLHKFPITNHSAIVAARSDDEIIRRRAFDTILNSYWKPVYKYVRLKWQAGNEDAKDLTQGFFANAFEKNHFASYDAAKASFQTFLRTCLDRFVANERKAGQRLKRGGEWQRVDLENLDVAFAADDDTLLAVHEALEKLAAIDPTGAKLIELRFFAGLSNVDAAKVLGLAERSAKRTWSYARAWLHEELTKKQSS